jgi:CheY-like chemotaxis protein
MLGRLLGEDIDLRIAAAPDLGLVCADPGQLDQVVMNLAVNARDAMPQGGLLRIELANVDLEAGVEAREAGIPPGRYVALSMRDTGCGMDARVLARIFEPFFTTKEVGCGTGLGLSTVFGIVKQSGGGLRVTSAPGRGTTFTVYLPRLDQAAAGALPPEDEVPTPGTVLGSETILVAEDEDGLRELICGVLRMYGYQVLAARNGAEALEICEQRGSGIDLLLTDGVMPVMSGPELVSRLRPRYPEMQIILISGYSDAILSRYGPAGPQVTFIQKPFKTSEIARKIRDLLNGAEAAAVA